MRQIRLSKLFLKEKGIESIQPLFRYYQADIQYLTRTPDKEPNY